MALQTASILAAGLGERIRETGSEKPFIRINGQPMLVRLIRQFANAGFDKVTCALRTNERDLVEELTPHLPRNLVNFFFVDTPSSFHTFYETLSRFPIAPGEHRVFSMVDSILRDHDLSKWIKFCNSLNSETSGLLVTPFVDDENPLRVKFDSKGRATSFDDPQSAWVTSGMYCFSHQVQSVAVKCFQQNLFKMRAFLKTLAAEQPIQCYEVAKTIDVDRPADIAIAEEFLK